MDYLDFYNEVLLIFKEEKPTNFRSLAHYLNEKAIIQDNLNLGNSVLLDITIETIDNLIDDCFVKGSKTATKTGPVYIFKGLTTQAYIYLESLEKEPKNTKEKITDYLKENGLPLDATSISKAAINLLL